MSRVLGSLLLVCTLGMGLCAAAPLRMTARLLGVEACGGRFTCFYFKITPPASRGELEENAHTYKRNTALFADKSLLTVDLLAELVTVVNGLYAGTFDATDILLLGW